MLDIIIIPHFSHRPNTQTRWNPTPHHFCSVAVDEHKKRDTVWQEVYNCEKYTIIIRCAENVWMLPIIHVASLRSCIHNVDVRKHVFAERCWRRRRFDGGRRAADDDDVLYCARCAIAPSTDHFGRCSCSGSLRWCAAAAALGDKLHSLLRIRLVHISIKRPLDGPRDHLTIDRRVYHTSFPVRARRRSYSI